MCNVWWRVYSIIDGTWTVQEIVIFAVMTTVRCLYLSLEKHGYSPRTVVFVTYFETLTVE